MPLKYRLLLCCILIAFTSIGQTLILKNNNADSTINLSKTQWYFQAGDNLEWSNPQFNDSGFQKTYTNFNPSNAPREWNDFGWFRIHIKNESLTGTNLWGLHLEQYGTSEIYLDGKKIGGIGNFGTTAFANRPAIAPFTVFPLFLNDTVSHLLAIRYSNPSPIFNHFTGFEATLGDMNYMNEEYVSLQNTFGFVLLSPAIQLMLVILFLLLFIFYPRQKIYLFYSLFVLTTALVSISRYFTVVTTDPQWQYYSYWIFVFSLTFIPLVSALLFYYVSFKRLPLIRILMVCLVTAGLVFYNLTFTNPFLLVDSRTFSILVNAATALVFIDGAIVIFRAIRGGNKLLWLIASALLITLLASIIVGSNMFELFTLKQVMTIVSAVSLALPLMFAFYFAIIVAGNNRSLEIQLNENKRLSEDNILKEQQKTKLIAGQAEELERTVMERTTEVRQQAAKLKEMDEAKSRFFVNLTHEFKTPLTLIINPAKELLHQSSDAASRKYAQYILQNSERLLQLINQLLDLSKLENHQLTISRQPLEMVQWLRVYVQQYDSMARKNNVHIYFKSPLPQLWLMTDLDKMEKMIQNLLTNAIKFSEQDGVITVYLIKSSEEEIAITVTDNGIGIPGDKLPFIFDRFYQADSSDTRAGEGVGIGLALTKELAELLGGQITVTSKLNEGSRFVLQLPVITARPILLTEKYTDKNEPVESKSSNSVEAEDDLPTILLVEDNEDLREFMVQSLAENYHIITAGNGEEGINLAFEKIPLLVITDLMMPRKDGYELCRTLKEDTRTSHIPIIMLTARTDNESRILGIETGADAYLPKPFDKRELLAVTQNLITIRRQLREKYGKDNLWLTGVEEMPGIEQTFLQKVRETIETNLDDTGFGADQLAMNIALSRTQLHRKLKQLINQSPGELIRTIRMKRAHELLNKNIANVTEVSYMVGYGNPANFSTSFSKYFGYPPSEAAKKK